MFSRYAPASEEEKVFRDLLVMNKQKIKKFNELPKSIKKTVRYINQDASIEDLKEIEKLISLAIEKRKKKFLNK